MAGFAVFMNGRFWVFTEAMAGYFVEVRVIASSVAVDDTDTDA